jgi:maltose O-acetyltransferase
MECGKNVYISRNCRLTPGTVSIGDDVYIGTGAIIQSTSSRIRIGNHVMFGPNVSIHGGNHRSDIVGRYMKSIRLEEKRPEVDDADVVIEDDVWLGDGAIILKGVTVGKGSVVGAGTVVARNIPPYSIVTSGNATTIRSRFTDEEIETHESILNNNR